MARASKSSKKADKVADTTGAKRNDESDAAARRSQTSNDSAHSVYRTVRTEDGAEYIVQERGTPEPR